MDFFDLLEYIHSKKWEYDVMYELLAWYETKREKREKEQEVH